MQLFVYKTVKCEIINVEFLSRDLPLNNSAIMVKWKYLKLLFSSKGMRRVESQLETWYVWNIWFLKHLVPFCLYSVIILVLHKLNTLSPMFSGVNKNNFSFFDFSNLSFFVFVYTTLKRKYLFLYIFSIDLAFTIPNQSTLISQEVFCDYQSNLGNTANLNSKL